MSKRPRSPADLAADPYFQLLLTQLKDTQLTKNADLLGVVRLVLENIENIKNIKKAGPYKKDLAINVIIHVIERSALSDEQKTTLFAMIEDGTVSTLIDTIIAASRGELVLNLTPAQARRSLGGCLKALLSMCRRKNAEPATAEPTAEPATATALSPPQSPGAEATRLPTPHPTPAPAPEPATEPATAPELPAITEEEAAAAAATLTEAITTDPQESQI